MKISQMLAGKNGYFLLWISTLLSRTAAQKLAAAEYDGKVSFVQGHMAVALRITRKKSSEEALILAENLIETAMKVEVTLDSNHSSEFSRYTLMKNRHHKLRLAAIQEHIIILKKLTGAHDIKKIAVGPKGLSSKLEDKSSLRFSA